MKFIPDIARTICSFLCFSDEQHLSRVIYGTMTCNHTLLLNPVCVIEQPNIVVELVFEQKFLKSENDWRCPTAIEITFFQSWDTHDVTMMFYNETPVTVAQQLAKFIMTNLRVRKTCQNLDIGCYPLLTYWEPFPNDYPLHEIHKTLIDMQ